MSLELSDYAARCTECRNMTGEWMSEDEHVKNLLRSEYWTQPETDFQFSDMQQKQIKEMQYMLSLVVLYVVMGTVPVPKNIIL